MSTIDKLLSEWRELGYKPTYEELLQVKAEQEKLAHLLSEAVHRSVEIKYVLIDKPNDLPATLKRQAS